MPFGDDNSKEPLVSDWLYVHTELLWANQREVEPRYLEMNYPPENTISAWLIKRGELVLKEPRGRITVKENQWIFPGLTTGWKCFRPGSVILSVRFTAEWPTGKTLYDHRNPIFLDAGDHLGLTRAAEGLKSVVSRISGRTGLFPVNDTRATVKDYFAIRHAFEGWLCAYVGTMGKLGISPSILSKADPRILRAARFIDNHPLRITGGESQWHTESG